MRGLRTSRPLVPRQLPAKIKWSRHWYQALARRELRAAISRQCAWIRRISWADKPTNVAKSWNGASELAFCSILAIRTFTAGKPSAWRVGDSIKSTVLIGNEKSPSQISPDSLFKPGSGISKLLTISARTES